MKNPRYRPLARLLALTACALASAAPLGAQGSQAALDLSGPGARAVFALDDDLPGAGFAPTDIGAADFALTFWVRGTLAANPTANAGGDVELGAGAWLAGNVVLDRSAVGTERDFGVSIAGGFVRFGTGAGDAPGGDAGHTLEGNVNVLDGAWHHVACARDAATGVKSIYVDAELDASTGPAVSMADLSYPDAGVGGPPENPELHCGAAKDAANAGFTGDLDELHLWDRALDQEDVVSWYDRVVYPAQPGLVAAYRFEGAGGAAVPDQSFPPGPAGALADGAAWRSAFASTADVAPISHGLLPYGFHRAIELENLVEPTSMQLLPGGELLIAERTGDVLRVDLAVEPPTVDTVLSINPNLLTIEYGIVGLALDPDFANNGWFYLHYTSFTPSDRVSRFTLTPGGVADPASEVIVWENLDVGPGHTGGSIVFGADGNLYIPTGDAFDPPQSQDLSHQNGKVLRINPDGTIPPDNPGASIPGAHPAIWAWGLRNPFRTWIDPATGTLWIADVGGDDGFAWEEVHHGLAGANYGWPDMEGPECQVADCSGMTPPFHAYEHGDSDLSPGAVAASITGGLVYSGANFPADYAGSYLFADYATGWLRRLRLGPGGEVADVPLFMPAFTAGTPVDLAVDAAGELLYLTVGLPWAGGLDDASVYRIRYTGDDPTPRSTVVIDTSPSGLILNLDGYPVQTPFTLETREGTSHHLSTGIIQFHEPTGSTLTFSCWTDGGAAEHGFTAPVGGANLTAVYTADGAGCDQGSGFATYGHGVGGVNTLGMVGGSGAEPGGLLTTKVTALSTAPGTGCWVGVSLNEWNFALLGGTVLIDSFAQFATVALPPVDGEALWEAPLPPQPGLGGATFYMQAIATDPGAPFGLVYSNGLRVTLAP